MNDHGFAFDAAWFKPHWEFRFPLLGQVQYEDVGLELRTALEPWHVMGEEGAVGGTVRYVDCSVERLEVKASGLTQGRHQVLVNGRPVPLRTVSRKAARRRRRALQGLAAGAWPASHHRAACAADHRNLGWLAQALASAAAPIMSPIPAAAISRFSRSTPMKPKAAGWRASSLSASPAACSSRPDWMQIPIFPIRWTCAGDHKQTPCLKFRSPNHPSRRRALRRIARRRRADPSALAGFRQDADGPVAGGICAAPRQRRRDGARQWRHL